MCDSAIGRATSSKRSNRDCPLFEGSFLLQKTGSYVEPVRVRLGLSTSSLPGGFQGGDRADAVSPGSILGGDVDVAIACREEWVLRVTSDFDDFIDVIGMKQRPVEGVLPRRVLRASTD